MPRFANSTTSLGYGMNIKRFIVELHRRSVWQVLGIYLFAGWGAVEVVKGLTETAGLPPWFPAAALAVLALFLPIVLAAAFVRESAEAQPGGVSGEYHLSTDSAAELLEERGPAVRFMANTRTALVAGASGMLLMALVGVWFASRQAGTGDAEELAPVPGTVLEPDGPQGALSLTTVPAGAEVRVTRISSDVGQDDPPPAPILASTPVEDLALPEGEYLLEFAEGTSNALGFTVSILAGQPLSRSVTLTPTSALTAGMLAVDEGVLLADTLGLRVPGFYIDRTEVANEEFVRFVRDGGYDEPSLWPETLSLLGGPLPRRDALARLVDETGFASPRNWSGAIYPQGEGGLPVTSVTWYEADAYCRWAGKRLPSFRQWWRAALGNTPYQYPWGGNAEDVRARANFSLRQVMPVGSYPTGASGFGVLDMAGNVREWVGLTRSDDVRALTVGGSWQDPTYTFDLVWQEPLPLGLDSPNTGFRCIRTIG